jgi:hypothetical protein
MTAKAHLHLAGRSTSVHHPEHMVALLKLLNIAPDGEGAATVEKSEHSGCHRRLAGGGLATGGAVMALYHHEAHAARDNAA